MVMQRETRSLTLLRSPGLSRRALLGGLASLPFAARAATASAIRLLEPQGRGDRGDIVEEAYASA